MGVVRASMGKKVFGKISVPSLLIWGDQDPQLDRRLTDDMDVFFAAPSSPCILPMAHTGFYMSILIVFAKR